MILQEDYGHDPVLNVTPKIHQELQDIRTILLDSVQRLIDRGERLDELVRKAQTLEITVLKFYYFLFIDKFLMNIIISGTKRFSLNSEVIKK